MPHNENAAVPIEQISLEERKREPGHSQEHWYILAGAYAAGLTVLDVGAGTGSGLTVLRAHGAKEVLGIDPLPAGDGVVAIDVSRFRDSSFDIVTCFDVVEHVEDDVNFLSHLLRVARGFVFLSTPNWNTWHCRNKYHVREYTPEELAALLDGRGAYACWTAAANRLEGPVHPCVIGEAQDSFCVMIRGSLCSDEQWLQAVSASANAAAVISEKLSRYGKWSDEWNCELKRILDDAPTATEGLHLAAQWLNGLVEFGPSVVPAGRKDPIMDVLRYGVGTHKELESVALWLCKSMVTWCK